MKLTDLDQHHWETGERIAVIETPKASRYKIDYDPDREIFHVHHMLPAGMIFPFDFGFIPGTKAADDDPLDVLIIMDQPGYPGLVVRIVLIGVLEAEQSEAKKTFRNDRLLARALDTTEFANVSSIKDVSKHSLDQLENFFVAYNRARGKTFKPLRRGGPKDAEKLIKKSSLKHFS
jgi:inorganic pyrophosphatase